MTTQNLCEIKSHTSSYANILPSEKKLISDSPSRTEISSASNVALCLSLSSASCKLLLYRTLLRVAYQRSTGKKSEKFQVNREQQKNSITHNYKLMPTKQHTETCYRTNNLRLWFKTRQNKTSRSLTNIKRDRQRFVKQWQKITMRARR